MPITYRLTHYAACGMPMPLIDEHDRAEIDEVRQRAARRLRHLRSEGYPVTTLERGREWEIGEPEDCVLIPDSCGILVLKPIPVRMVTCRECEEEMPEEDSHMHDCAREYAEWEAGEKDPDTEE